MGIRRRRWSGGGRGVLANEIRRVEDTDGERRWPSSSTFGERWLDED